jgi:hypothetical protein
MTTFLRQSRPNLAEIDASSETSLNPKTSLRTAFSQSMTDISQKLKSFKIKDFFRRNSTVDSRKEEDTKKLSPSHIKKDMKLEGLIFLLRFLKNI